MNGNGASRVPLRILLAGVFALAVACGGGGGGSHTEPPKTYTLIASGLMANTSGCCLQEVQLILDGVAQTTYNTPPTHGSVVWDINLDAAGRLHVVPISPGRHDIVIRIIRDAAAPGDYNAAADIEVRDQTANLVIKDSFTASGHFNGGDGPTWAFSF